jgi:hypothetical protein
MKRAAVPSILVAVVLLALGVIAEAQQVKKIPHIGFLSALSPDGVPAWLEAGSARAWVCRGEERCH